MQQAIDFILIILCACVFFAVLFFGFALCFVRRPVSNPPGLQKLSGLILIVLAVNVLLLNFELFLGTSAGYALRIILLIADLFATITIVTVMFRHYHVTGTQPSTGNIPAQPGGSTEDSDDIAEIVKAYTPDLSDGEGPSVQTGQMTMAEENDPMENADSEIVEPLEDPNVNDLIFFQKVECLMLKERLFCEQEISREEVAAAIGTNRTYLARSIKSATGKTFSEYINDLRVIYAANLLATSDEPLDLIGTLVGFRSKSAYYRAFSAAYNCSPSEYRKRSASGQDSEPSES